MDPVTAPIIIPGRPGDLRMIFGVGLEAVDEIKTEHDESGTLDEPGLFAVAKAIELCIQMWRGEIPVEQSALSGIAQWVH